MWETIVKFVASLPQLVVNGISLGAVYAIIALGYSMVYGIAKMLNFAHGDVIMVGGFLCWIMAFRLGLPPVLGVLVAMIGCTALGLIVERMAYKPLRQAGSLAVLITAIGVSTFLQNGAQLVWGTGPFVFNSVVNFGTIRIGSVNISSEAIVTVVVCILIMVGLTWFTGKTKMGRAMRAVSEDKGAAQLMGINVNFTISLTFAIGSALAAVAGVLYLSRYPSNLTPTMGSMPGIKAFTAAVFGGIGSIPGAMLGGVLLGLIEIFGNYVCSELADAIVFAVLIIVLLVKPAGLLGKQVREKV